MAKGIQAIHRARMVNLRRIQRGLIEAVRRHKATEPAYPTVCRERPLSMHAVLAYDLAQVEAGLPQRVPGLLSWFMGDWPRRAFTRHCCEADATVARVLRSCHDALRLAPSTFGLERHPDLPYDNLHEILGQDATANRAMNIAGTMRAFGARSGVTLPLTEPPTEEGKT
jgi:hypothetical protein